VLKAYQKLGLTQIAYQSAGMATSDVSALETMDIPPAGDQTAGTMILVDRPLGSVSFARVTLDRIRMKTRTRPGFKRAPHRSAARMAVKPAIRSLPVRS
jgi:hypothetical protein